MPNLTQFNQVQGQNGLYQSSASLNLFFVINTPAGGAQYPQQFSLSDSWNTYNGVYVFTICKLSSTSPQWQEYCTKLMAEVQLLISKAAKDIDYPTTAPYKGIIWLEDNVNPNAEDPVTINNGECLFLLIDGGEYITIYDHYIGFGNLTIPIPNTTFVLPAADKSNYGGTQATINGLVFTYTPWRSHEADYPPHPGFQWYLSLTDTDTGLLEGQLALKNQNADVLRDWMPGIRYNITPDIPNASAISQFYPLLPDSISDLVVYNIKWKPRDTQSTFLGFSDRSITLNNTQTAIDWPDSTDPASNNLLAFEFDKLTYHSCFNSVSGNHKILLIMQDDAGLVISNYTNTDGTSRYFLMPSGTFEIALETKDSDYVAGNQVKLLCGLAGTEFIKVVPRYGSVFGDCIKFTPQVQTNPTTNADVYVHTLISISQNPANPTAPTYYSQPKAASMFVYENNPLPEPLVNPILASTDIMNATLKDSIMFPLVPYGNLVLSQGLAFTDLAKYEFTSLSVQRKQSIASQVLSHTPPKVSTTLNITSDTSQITATPQGFLATIDSGGLNWSSVTMALSEAGSFEFAPYKGQNYIPNVLRDTLQSNQLFLVVTTQNNKSDKKILGQLNSNITIDGWPFEAVVPQAVDGNDYNNVLIFKFCQGTLKDLATNYRNWNQGDYYNIDPQATSTWLYDYICQAELAVQDSNGSGPQNPLLQNFVDTVNNPAWNGVLMLKVDVSVQDFPEELEGLVAGINLNQFYGHHIGFNVNKLDYNSGSLQITDSSIFGLINYVATDSDKSSTSSQSTTDSTDPVYQFNVLSLQVAFQNSKVRSFASRIQLTANNWFGEAGVLNQGTGIQGFGIYAIEMNGHMQSNNGKNVYTFVTNPGQVYQFNMQSQVFNYIEITNAAFITLNTQPAPSPPPGDTGKVIKTHFVFSGYLNFKQLAPFDAFCFGDTTLSQPNGLCFNALAVEMDFNLYTNPTTDVSNIQNQVFTFDPGNITFDMSQSNVRDNSMYNKFPLSLKTLVYSNTGSDGATDNPSDHGYLPISINTDNKFSGLGNQWYGIAYNLNLGTPGALAAKMDFTASILVAWSPGGNQLQLDIGIKFPGSGGAKKLLALENVIKLSIGQILFEAIKQEGSEAKLAYVLTFFNIGLKFFSINLPMHGALNAALFGDPNQNNSSGSSLGWYAAYDNMNTKKVS